LGGGNLSKRDVAVKLELNRKVLEIGHEKADAAYPFSAPLETSTDKGFGGGQFDY
jgi:hypothetical protein